MKTIWITVFLICLISCDKGKLDSEINAPEGSKTCRNSEKNASLDFFTGNFTFCRYLKVPIGLFYEDILDSLYNESGINLKLIHQFSIDYPEGDNCYCDQMNRLMKARVGSGFSNKIDAEAESCLLEHVSADTFTNEFLDPGPAYFLYDSARVRVDSILYSCVRSLRDHLRIPGLEFSIQMTVNREGSVIDLSLLQDSSLSPMQKGDFEKKMLSAVSRYAFVPMQVEHHPVNARILFRIILD